MHKLAQGRVRNTSPRGGWRSESAKQQGELAAGAGSPASDADPGVLCFGMLGRLLLHELWRLACQEAVVQGLILVLGGVLAGAAVFCAERAAAAIMRWIFRHAG